MRYVINHEEKFGDKEEFKSLKEATECYRGCGEDYVATSFTERDGQILDETGEVVGQVKREAVSIEVCNCVEWLEHFGDEAPEGCRDEIASTYRQAAFESLADSDVLDEEDGDEIDNAQSGRILYHGWNGAQFDYRRGGVGGWGKFSDAMKEEIDAADEAGRKAVDEWVKRLPTEAYPSEEEPDNE